MELFSLSCVSYLLLNSSQAWNTLFYISNVMWMIIHYINNTFLFGTNLTWILNFITIQNWQLWPKINNTLHSLSCFTQINPKKTKVNFIRRFIQVKSDINLSLRTHCTILDDIIQVLSGLLKSKYLFKLSI